MGCCTIADKDAQKSRKLTISKQNFIKIHEGKPSDSYTILKNIGDGAFGKILKVVHKETNSIRALKRIQITKSLKIDQMMSEVNLLSKIDHSNILRIFEVIQEPSHLNIVTELCTGGDLFSRIESNKKFSEKLASAYMLDIVSAVKYCHDHQIVHCDLKPENILFESMEEDARLKVIDFGTSKYVKPAEKLTGFIGSIFYVAPEVISGKYDEKCDVWSLGVILFIMLTGKPPFDGENDFKILEKIKNQELDFDGEMWESISKSCKKLLRKMLVKDPELRVGINEVIKDKWFKRMSRGKVTEVPIAKECLEQLKTFSVLGVVEELRAIFEKLDENKDGVLSKEELMKGYEDYFDELPEDFEKIMNDCDVNGSGFIDYSEFITAALNWQKALSSERLKAAFRLFDLDGSGKISIVEFLRVLQGTGIKEDLVREIMKVADKNDDGEIDFQEFEEYMRMPSLFSPSNRC